MDAQQERDLRETLKLLEPHLKGNDEVQIAYDMILAALEED
jgi:hypothetical protein